MTLAEKYALFCHFADKAGLDEADRETAFAEKCRREYLTSDATKNSGMQWTCLQNNDRDEAWNAEFWNNFDKKDRITDNSYTPERVRYRVLFDMDGVLARFLKGKTMEEVFSKGYFRNLEPLHNMTEAVGILVADGNVDVGILSKTSYQGMAEKYVWLLENIPQIDSDSIYFVPLESEKSIFIPNFDPEYDFLIDDYQKNLDSFEGQKMKCVNDINSPTDKYPNIYYDETPGTIAYTIEKHVFDYVKAKNEPEEEIER